MSQKKKDYYKSRGSFVINELWGGSITRNLNCIIRFPKVFDLDVWGREDIDWKQFMENGYP